MEIKDLSYEEAYNKLESILDKVEKEDLSLKESIELFKNANELYLHCQKLLDSAEGEVKLILDGKEEDFDLSTEV